MIALFFQGRKDLFVLNQSNFLVEEPEWKIFNENL